MRRRRILLLMSIAGSTAAVVAITRPFGPSPLPAPPPWAGPLPPASPPAEMKLLQLPTGVTHRSAGFAYQGGSFRDRREFAMTVALIEHPRGDLLIDTGFGRDIDQQIRAMPALFRAMTSYSKGRTAAEQLDAAGYDRKKLRGVLLTHAHWDHLSGVTDLPGVPVLVTAEERRFIREGGWIMEFARRLSGVHYEEYAFDGGPYLGFPTSHDFYGDGSIVIVPSPGHTPGSVVIFVTLPDQQRFAFVGDLVWQREGITEREERPWYIRYFADDNPAGTRENILRVSAIVERFPEISVVPAHDSKGFADLPTP
jgi:glyoxylase-like metal-dependent hydrolase (beta-lactamase superfamily II)